MSDSIKGIAFSPDGKWIAGGGWNAGGRGGTLTVWEAMTGKVRSTLPFWGGTVAWSPDGNYFAYGWNGEDLSLRLVGTGHRLFGLGYKGSLVNFWFGTPRLHRFVGEETGFERIIKKLWTPDISKRRRVSSICPFSPDGTRLIACDGHTIFVVDAKTGEILTSFTPHRWSWSEAFDGAHDDRMSNIGATVFSPHIRRKTSVSYFRGTGRI